MIHHICGDSCRDHFSDLESESEPELDIININNGKTVLFFSGDFCEPCKKLYPAYELLKSNNTDINFHNCDINEYSNLADLFDVRKLPCFVFLINGSYIKKINTTNEIILSTEIDNFKN